MNFEKSPQENQETSEKLKPKAATRTVLFDQNGQVAIINVRRHKYYKILVEESKMEKTSKMLRCEKLRKNLDAIAK